MRNSDADHDPVVAYFDSSAMVKLLVEEDGSGLAAELWDLADIIACSLLGYPEICAALAAAERSGRMDEHAAAHARLSLEELWAGVLALDLSGPVEKAAGEIARSAAVRGADAVHLASALELGVDTIVFASWDIRQRAGATHLGLTLSPPDLGMQEPV